MPAKSKKQYEMMRQIRDGELPDGYRGISKQLASEFIEGQTPDYLPDDIQNVKPSTSSEKLRTKYNKIYK